jgi:hypothetical protein
MNPQNLSYDNEEGHRAQTGTSRPRHQSVTNNTFLKFLNIQKQNIIATFVHKDSFSLQYVFSYLKKSRIFCSIFALALPIVT